MFASLPSLLLAVAVLYTFYVLWTKIRLWSVAKGAGCSVPVKYRHLDPFLGLDLFIKKIQRTKQGTMLALDEEIFAKYGKTLLTNFLGKNKYMTMDPVVIQAIAGTEADNFGNEPTNRRSCGPLLGDGAFTVDGELWKRSRENINPIFTRSQGSQLESLRTHFKHFLEQIPADGVTVEIQPLTKALFLDTSTEFILGKSSRDSGIGNLSGTFDEALRGMRINYMAEQLSWLPFVGPDSKWLKTCAQIHAVIDGLIEAEIHSRREEKESGIMKDEKSSSYKYILLRELVKKYPDDKVYIRNELMNVFFPARDSVGVTSAAIVFFLARHKEVWEKVREEVRAIPEKQELTFEFLKGLKYVQAVIDESKSVDLYDL